MAAKLTLTHRTKTRRGTFMTSSSIGIKAVRQFRVLNKFRKNWRDHITRFEDCQPLCRFLPKLAASAGRVRSVCGKNRLTESSLSAKVLRCRIALLQDVHNEGYAAGPFLHLDGARGSRRHHRQ